MRSPSPARRVAGFGAIAVARLLTGAVVLAACSSSPAGSSEASGVKITASDTTCQLAQTSFRAGTHTFAISNAGSQVTAVYVYSPGDHTVGEVGNVGPSTGKKLTVALKAGHYEVVCKPGMVGQGIRTPITVKAVSGSAPSTSPQLEAAVASYRRYVIAEARLLAPRVAPFVAAVRAGDVDKAKSLYAAARVPYEAIAPIAESFGDLDSRIDARIDNVESGQEWIGFHRLEHDLWTSFDISRDGPVAAQLQSDMTKLVEQVQTVELSADQVAGAATTLLDEVAATKVNGQEEHYSHLDLVDVAANVQGSYVAYQSLRPIVLVKASALVTKLDARYATLQQDLAQYGSGANFPRYDTLRRVDIHVLTADVNTLRDALAGLSDAALKA